MDDETRSEFAKIAHYFELSQAQFLELRKQVGSIDEKVTSLHEKVGSLDEKVGSLDEKVTSIDEKVTSLDEKLTSLDEKVTSLASEFRAFRDWTVTQFAEFRRELVALRSWVETRLSEAGL